jgi:AcrR family transcriptional regulator
MNVSTLAAIRPGARRTRDRLLEALEALLKTRDFDQISVAEIAAAAGVSVGSVYAHFRDKNAFLDTLLQRHRARLRRMVEAPVETAPFPDLKDAIAAMVRAAMAQADADAHLLRALAAYIRNAPDSDIATALEISDAGCLRIEAYLAPYDREIASMSVAEAANFIHWFLNSVFYRRVMSPAPFMPPQRIPPDDQLADRITVMIHGALTVKPA